MTTPEFCNKQQETSPSPSVGAKSGDNNEIVGQSLLGESSSAATAAATITTPKPRDCRDLNASDVVKFYKNKNILITGASGFLGKVLLWKLLDTCPDIGKIFVLLRSKNNVSAEKRLVQLLKVKPFNFKHLHDDLFEKVVAIESDITTEGLGLSQSDRTLLQEQVHIVFHSAASVKFDAPLKDNLRDNVYGTCSIVKLCNTIKNLKALVHVSTAYSNCQSRDIAEDIQPLERDVDDIVKVVE